MLRPSTSTSVQQWQWWPTQSRICPQIHGFELHRPRPFHQPAQSGNCELWLLRPRQPNIKHRSKRHVQCPLCPARHRKPGPRPSITLAVSGRYLPIGCPECGLCRLCQSLCKWCRSRYLIIAGIFHGHAHTLHPDYDKLRVLFHFLPKHRANIVG